MRKFFANIIWTEQRVIFELKKPLMAKDSSLDACIERANELLDDVAQRVARTHFRLPVGQVKAQLFFELYNTRAPEEGSFYISDNAPDWAKNV